MIRSIHPFPARMAPDLAISELRLLCPKSIVLDPMSGSGTVIRHASELGHRAVGFDMDPLAVLMARVWTTPVPDNDVENAFTTFKNRLGSRSTRSPQLFWIDDDDETSRFVKFWFGRKQRNQLRPIASVLHRMGQDARSQTRQFAINILRVALSRIIITKDQGASLARDVSHSRPHKVAEASDFDVLSAFYRSVSHVRRLLSTNAPLGEVGIELGDARNIQLRAASVDAVMTSPPYLNAIDYMRGHRLSLVWLGYSLSQLRAIRSLSIGAERAADGGLGSRPESIRAAMCDIDKLEPRHRSMVSRYADDLDQMMSEVARVLRPGGRAILVVGNSCLKGAFIRNSDGVIRAGEAAGLALQTQTERELPERSRYLPMATGSLAKRMRTETIVTFEK